MRCVRVGVSETAVGRPPHAAGAWCVVLSSSHPHRTEIEISQLVVLGSPTRRSSGCTHFCMHIKALAVCVAASLCSCRCPKLNKTPGHAVAVHRMMYLNQILVADLSCFPYRVKCMGCHHLSASKKAARLGYGGEHFGPSNSNPTGIGWPPTVEFALPRLT